LVTTVIDRLIEIAGRLGPQLRGIGTGPACLFGLGSPPFNKQIALLRIGGDRLPPARLAFAEKLFQGDLRLVEHCVAFGTVGLGATDADQGTGPPEERLPLQFGGGSGIGFDAVNDLERDIGHLPIFEGLEQKPARSVSGCLCRGVSGLGRLGRSPQGRQENEQKTAAADQACHGHGRLHDRKALKTAL
jgi:hypothetical protein